MKNLAKNILFFTLATLSHSAFAQKNVSEQVNVVRSYKPILAEALRINTNPEIKTDLVQIEPLNYQKIIFGLDSLTKTSPVEAEKMKSESITKIYPAYLRLAGGNYANSLVDFYLSNLRAKDYQTGLAYNHRAASNSKVANMNNSTNNLSAWAKKMNTSNTLSAAFNYNRGVSNYYGYNHDSLIFSKDTTRQQYDIISLQTSLVSNIDNTSKLKYDVFFNAYSLNDAWSTKENRMITGGNFSYDVYDFKIGLDASQSEKNAISNKNNLMEFSPNVSLKEGEGTLTIGLISFIESGDKSSFHAYPNVKYTYEWKAASLVAFAGMNGKMHKNSLYQFAQENPFIGSVNILNTNEKLTLYAGARGSIGTKTAYLLNVNLSQTENDAYFVVDQSDMRKYTIIYDGKNASAFHLSAEMTHQSNSKLRLFGKLNIHSYQTDTLREAYHRPTYEINAGATYAIADKFRLQLDMIAYSSMKAPDYRLGTINNIDGGTDLNLAIDYKYSKIISVFTQFNNILNYQRARYLYYNNYGFQAMLGLSFNFKMMHQKIVLAITELLNKSESLEIQGFGRFSKKEVHANFSNNQAVLNAAKHLLVFEVDLNCKDFQLAEYLATQTQITIQEAQSNIEQLVLEWKSALSKGESINLAQLGTITANNEIWQLNPVAESLIDAESYGFSPIKIQTITPVESTIEQEENLIPNAESNFVPENKLEGWKQKKIAQIKNWNWRNISIASSVFLIAYISLFIVSRPSILSKQKSANLKQAITATIPQVADTINTSKDSVLNVPVIDTIVPIAQIVKSNRVFKQKHPIAIIAEETIDTESDSLTDTDTSLQPVEAAPISENIWSPKKYQLVAGVYKNKLAAENAQMNLNFTGFEAKIIKLKKSYRVIIGDYDTLKEAKENLTLANQINPIFYLHIQ